MTALFGLPFKVYVLFLLKPSSDKHFCMFKVNLKESLGRGSLLRRGKAFIDFSTHDLADLAYRCLAGRLSFNGEPAKVGFAAKRRTGGGRMQNTQQGRQAPSRERGEDWSDDH